jgi:hypothetical protein
MLVVLGVGLLAVASFSVILESCASPLFCTVPLKSTRIFNVPPSFTTEVASAFALLPHCFSRSSELFAVKLQVAGLGLVPLSTSPLAVVEPFGVTLFVTLRSAVVTLSAKHAVSPS